MTAVASSLRQRLIGALAVIAAIGGYYAVYFLPPRLLGALDPDRYYHIAISRLTAQEGLLRVLPQVEDLGWGRYFPDKEFLFHALTGAAYWLGGVAGVLAVVPLLGLAIVLCLYAEISRVTRPLAATMIAIVVPLITAAFLFRLSLLRPHLLAVFWFCLLLVFILRDKPRWAAVAAGLFALSYHAFFIVILVAASAWLVRDRTVRFSRQAWVWTLAGLTAGLVLNPYFPSNLGMGAVHLKLALGLGDVPHFDEGFELRPFGAKKLLLSYGFLAFAVVAAWATVRPRWRDDRPLVRGLWFLLVVTGGFWILGIKSPRAMEYATPACMLLLGYATALSQWRLWWPAMLAASMVIQGYVAQLHYISQWQPSLSAYGTYAAVLEQVPRRPGGFKVFNCDWESGSFILMARPDLRFVDLLEPSLLWNASRDKYVVRTGLRTGAFDNPRFLLRGLFKADYVICAAPKLIGQMDARPEDFTSAPGTKGEEVRLFAVRPGDP